MTERALVAPPDQIRVTLALAPARSAVTSLALLNSDYSGLSEWVAQTAAQLSPEQAATNKWAAEAAAAHLGEREWPSFPAWVDDLSRRDPTALRDEAVENMLKEIAAMCEEPVPDRDELLSDPAVYMALMARVHECSKAPFKDREKAEAEYARLQDPLRRQQEMVAHLREMWQLYLAAEWERCLPALQESIVALRSLDYTGLSLDEIMKRVTDRELPREWESLVGQPREMVFVPSQHIGPYLMLVGFRPARSHIVFGARMPEGAAIRSPALSRSELAMRLSALADDTRLRILQLAAQQGEQRAQDVIAKLDLSQSAASRHLRQLSATGYLIERRCEGAKCYRLNPDRIDSTFRALQAFLQ